MNLVALQMLFGDRGKAIGMILGLTFVSLLITQSSAVFLGIMNRTVSAITDVWVMDPMVRFVHEIKPLRDTELYLVPLAAAAGHAAMRGTLRCGSHSTETGSSGLRDTRSIAAGPAEATHRRQEQVHAAAGKASRESRLTSLASASGLSVGPTENFILA